MRWRRWVGLVLLLVIVGACTSDTQSDDSQQVTRPSATPEPTIEPTEAVTATPSPTQTPSATFDPFLTPSPTPCVLNPEWTDVYTVRAGDTLGAIAIATGTTVEELAASNCMSTRDFLYEGQEIQVPNALAVEIARAPDGLAGTVAFIRKSEDNSRNIWTIRSSGVAPLQLTTHGYVIGEPVRSPELDLLAFRVISEFHIPDPLAGAGPGTQPGDVYVIHVNGTQLAPLSRQGPLDLRFCSLPAWAPDGSRVAFAEQEQDSFSGSLVTINPDGTRRFVIAGGDFTPPGNNEPVAPAWSPDGTQITYVRFYEDGTASIQITSVGEARERILAENIRYAEGPYWVPLNGLRGTPAVAYAIQTDSGVAWYVVDPLTGTNLLRETGLAYISNDLSGMVRGQDVFYQDNLLYVMPSADMHDLTWSPVSTQFIYPTEDGLLLVDLENTLEEQITGSLDESPVWAPPLRVVLP